MARNVEAQLNAEADRKGLTGDRRRAYIGGAWDRITRGRERRTSWHHSADHQALDALGIKVDEARTPHGRQHRGHVYFRQGGKWYDLPRGEWQRLVREGQLELKAKEREAKASAAAKELIRKDNARRERKAQAELAQQERVVQRVARAEYSDVLKLIREVGGIKRSVTSQGVEHDKGEYDRLPGHVKHRAGSRSRYAHSGLTPDEMAGRINDHMPWLKIDTPNDLYDYFDAHEVRRRHGHAA